MRAIGEHASRIIIGLFIALALVVALQHDRGAEATTLALIGTTLALMIGEVYAHVVEAEITSGRRPGRGEIAHGIAEQSYIALGAAPPIVLFALAWAGAIEESTALDVSVWGGVGVLAWLGFIAGLATGRTKRSAILHAGALALFGAIIIVIKVLQHH